MSRLSGKRSPYYGKVDAINLPSPVRTIWYSREDEPEPVEYYKLCDREWQDLQAIDHAIDSRVIIQCLLNKLTEKEKDIFVMRIVDGMTLEEIGQEYGVTRERIRQIEGRAQRKMLYWVRENKRFEKAMREYREQMLEVA